MSAIIQINSGTPGVSNDNLPLDTVVTLTSVDTALQSYTWAIVSQPAGPNDNIVGSGQTVTFTPTKEGSYLVKLTVDFGYPSEDSQQLIAAVRELETGDRIPAIGETTENSVNDGWANPVDSVLQRVTRFTDAGVQPGVAAESLAVGDVVYASDSYTLADGLPGQRVVASWSKAHADVPAEVQGVFGVVAGSVLGGSIATDDVITVQTTGLCQGVPFASAPSVGDPVFISDAAQLSLSQGTIKRQIGTVCAVGVSTFDVMVGPAPAEIAPENLYVKTYYVSTDGSDVVGDGSMHNPYATPQKAHDVALVEYPTEWVSVEIGPGSYVGDLTIEKWNIVFHGSGSRPETQATKLFGAVTVQPDGATQKFNQVVGLDRMFVEPTGGQALIVTGTGAFSCIVTDCYLTTGDATSTCAVLDEPSNPIRPRVTLNDCIVTVQAAGPDIIVLDRGDVRMSGVQALFGSTVPSGSAGKGITVNNDASLFADRLLLDIQTLGPGIEVTGTYAGTKLTLSTSSVTLSNASSSHAISATNGSAGQLAVFAWNCAFGLGNAASKIINGTGALGSNIAMVGQISALYGTVGGLGSTVTRLDMSPGVLAYTNASYPAPSGLTPVSASTIPVAGAAGTATQFKADNSSGATQSPGLRLVAGSNAGAGQGGDARLVGGESATGDGSAIVADGATALAGGGVTLVAGLGPIGGAVVITAGQGDTTLGGDVTIDGGAGGTNGGNVLLTGGLGTVDGGGVALSGGVGAGGAGGSAGLQGGNGVVGGAALIQSGDGSAGAAGTLDIRGGAGSGGVGGDVFVQGGNSSTHTGGSVSVTAGAGPTGGAALVTGGASSGASVAGGAAGIVAGAGTTGDGGAAGVLGGNSTGGGNGGSTAIDAGTGATNGHVVVGTIRAEYVTLGRTGKNVTTSGLNVEAAVTYAPVVGTPIPVTSPTIILNAAAPITLTGTPNVQTSGITAGTRVTFIGGANAVTFQRVSALAGSALRLANPTQALDLYDVMTLIFDGTNWREVSVSLNS